MPIDSTVMRWLKVDAATASRRSNGQQNQQALLRLSLYKHVQGEHVKNATSDCCMDAPKVAES